LQSSICVVDTHIITQVTQKTLMANKFNMVVL